MSNIDIIFFLRIACLSTASIRLIGFQKKQEFFKLHTEKEILKLRKHKNILNKPEVVYCIYNENTCKSKENLRTTS